MGKFQEYIKKANLSEGSRKALCECAAACFGNALFEGPHVSLEYDPIAHTELVWDFYDERPEGKDGKWLLQLVSLFRDGFMDPIYSPTGEPERYVLPSEKRQTVIDDIASSFEFRMYAPYGYMEASPEVKELVDKWVPQELLDILHEERKPRPKT